MIDMVYRPRYNWGGPSCKVFSESFHPSSLMLALRNVGCRWVNAQLALDSATHSRLVECIGPEFSPWNTLQGSLFHAWDLTLAMIFVGISMIPQIWCPKSRFFYWNFTLQLRAHARFPDKPPKCRIFPITNGCYAPSLLGSNEFTISICEFSGG